MAAVAAMYPQELVLTDEVAERDGSDGLRHRLRFGLVTSCRFTWSQVIPRDTGEAQLAIVGKGDKPRNILIPAEVAAALHEMRADGPDSARDPISERRINYIVKATAKRAGVNVAVSAHWLRHAHASHAIDEGA